MIEINDYTLFFYLLQLFHVLLFLQSENSYKGSLRRITINQNATLISEV